MIFDSRSILCLSSSASLALATSLPEKPLEIPISIFTKLELKNSLSSSEKIHKTKAFSFERGSCSEGDALSKK